MISKAAEISQRPGHWYCDQLNNHAAISGYLPLGEELWQQSQGRIDVFVHCVGTAHSIHCIGLRVQPASRPLRPGSIQTVEAGLESILRQEAPVTPAQGMLKFTGTVSVDPVGMVIACCT